MNINDEIYILNKQIEELTEVAIKIKEYIENEYKDCEQIPEILEDILYKINSIENKIENKGYLKDLLRELSSL